MCLGLIGTTEWFILLLLACFMLWLWNNRGRPRAS